MTDRTDAELVCLARAGDNDAFGELASRHQVLAERVARRMVGSDDLAQSLAQEAVLQAYLSLSSLRTPERFASWLHGIVLNVCRRFIRDQRGGYLSWEALEGGLPVQLSGLEDWAPQPEEVLEERELHRLVWDAVSALPSATRSATLLFYYEGRTQQDIASLLGISVSAVKVRLFRARQRLRTYLAAAGLEREKREEGRSGMVHVQVADVIRRRTGETEQHVVVLSDLEGGRVLPIWVGRFEAEMLAMHLANRTAPRPLTYDLMGNLLAAAGARIGQVRLQALQQGVVKAVVLVRVGNATHEVDARPSDALNLALRTGAPVLVTDEVMEQLSIPVPAWAGGTPSARGAQGIVSELEEGMKRLSTRTRSTSDAAEAKSQEQMQQELIAWLFDAPSGA